MNLHEVETWTFHNGQAAPFLAGLPRWFEYVGEHPELFPEWISGALVREIDGSGGATGRFRMTFAYDSLANLTSYRARRSRPTPGYEDYLTLDVGYQHIDPNRLSVKYWEEVRSAVWRRSGSPAVGAQEGRHT